MIPIPLGPLQELEVVLHLALDELLNVDGSVNSMSCEAVLEDLEVLQVCVFGIDIEFDSSHGDIEIDTVEDLAESGTSSTLLNLRDI